MNEAHKCEAEYEHRCLNVSCMPHGVSSDVVSSRRSKAPSSTSNYPHEKQRIESLELANSLVQSVATRGPVRKIRQWHLVAVLSTAIVVLQILQVLQV